MRKGQNKHAWKVTNDDVQVQMKWRKKPDKEKKKIIEKNRQREEAEEKEKQLSESKAKQENEQRKEEKEEKVDRREEKRRAREEKEREEEEKENKKEQEEEKGKDATAGPPKKSTFEVVNFNRQKSVEIKEEPKTSFMSFEDDEEEPGGGAPAIPTSPEDDEDAPGEVPTLLRQVSQLEKDGVIDLVEKDVVKDLLKKKNARALEWVQKSLTDRASFKKLAGDEVQNRMKLEKQCREEQLTELQALLSIFSHEISIAESRPLCFKVMVVLLEIDCHIELGFLFPPLYPLEDAIVVNSYIPPPFNGRKGSHEDSLQEICTKKAAEMKGLEGGSAYAVVEVAKGWVESNLALLKKEIEVTSTLLETKDFVTEADPDDQQEEERALVALTEQIIPTQGTEKEKKEKKNTKKQGAKTGPKAKVTDQKDTKKPASSSSTSSTTSTAKSTLTEQLVMKREKKNQKKPGAKTGPKPKIPTFIDQKDTEKSSSSSSSSTSSTTATKNTSTSSSAAAKTTTTAAAAPSGKKSLLGAATAPKQAEKKKAKAMTDEQVSRMDLRLVQRELPNVYAPGTIKASIERAIESVQSQTGLSKASAKVQLINHQWNVKAVVSAVMSKEDWECPFCTFRNKWNSRECEICEADKPGIEDQESEESVEEKLKAVTEFQSHISSATFTCLVCFEEKAIGLGATMSCEHWMCIPCWRDYLISKISGGDPFIRCPGHKCTRYVEEEMIMALVQVQEYYKRYRRWLEHSLIKLKGWKWCPNPDCQSVASCEAKSDFDSSEVIACLCGWTWCFYCQKEAHWPVKCATRDAYIASDLVKTARKAVKATVLVDESKNFGVPTKPCPKCRTPWWKNGGCNHFTCTCGYEFCWICLGEWGAHGGSFYECAKKENETKEVILNINSTITIGDDTKMKNLRRYIERELDHAMIQAKLRALMKSPKKMINLSRQLPGTSPFLIFRLCGLLHESHSRLRFAYVFFYLYFDLYRKSDEAGGWGRRLRYAFTNLEQFTDVLDRVIVPVVKTHRMIISLHDILIRVQTLQKFAAKYVEAMKQFENETTSTQRTIDVVNHFADYEAQLKAQKEKLLAQGYREG